MFLLLSAVYTHPLPLSSPLPECPTRNASQTVCFPNYLLVRLLGVHCGTTSPPCLSPRKDLHGPAETNYPPPPTPLAVALVVLVAEEQCTTLMLNNKQSLSLQLRQYIYLPTRGHFVFKTHELVKVFWLKNVIRSIPFQNGSRTCFQETVEQTRILEFIVIKTFLKLLYNS